MAELEGEAKHTALALQTEIRHKRAQVVADIDELRHSLRVRTSPAYILHTHPRVMQGLTIALGIFGVATLALLYRATTRRRRLG